MPNRPVRSAPIDEEERYMAVQTPIPVHFAQVFPDGAYITGPIEPVMAYDKETGAKLGQAKHPVTGELMWEAPVHDADQAEKS
jgi:hypothetical protein